MIVSVNRSNLGDMTTWIAPDVRHVAIGREAFFYYTDDEAKLGDAVTYTVVSSAADIASFKEVLEAYRPDISELPADKKAEFYATIGL